MLYDVLRLHFVDLRLLEFALRRTTAVQVSVDGSGYWLQVDVVLNGLDRAQVAVSHGFHFGEHFGDFLTVIGELIVFVDDLAPFVC